MSPRCRNMEAIVTLRRAAKVRRRVWLSESEAGPIIILATSFSWLGNFLGGFLMGERSRFKKCLHGALPFHSLHHVFICGFRCFLANKCRVIDTSFGQRHGNVEK